MKDLEFTDPTLGGSGVSGDISPLIWVISIVTLLITLLRSSHEPPSIHYRLHLGCKLSRVARIALKA